MKNAASCENECELQNSLIIDTSNAHGGSGLRGPCHVRLRVGRSYKSKSIHFTPRESAGFRSALDCATAPGHEGSDAWKSSASRLLFLTVDVGSRGAGFTFCCATNPSPSGARALTMTRLRDFPSKSGRDTLSHQSRPQIGRDHPLNLSISLSGGKETNQDSLSSGE